VAWSSRRHPLLQLCQEVLDQHQRGRRRPGGRANAQHQEALSVWCHVVGLCPGGHEVATGGEQPLLGHDAERRPGRHVSRLHVVCGIEVEQLVALGTPMRRRSTVGGDLPLGRLRIGKRPNEYLEPPRLVRCIRQPFAIGRKRRAPLAKRGCHQRLRSAVHPEAHGEDVATGSVG
jgi:hypothetical protein